MEPAGTSKGNSLITLHPTPEWLTVLREADVDLLSYDGTPAAEAARPLAEAAQRIQHGPGVHHPLRPAGGPPAGFDAVRILQWAAGQCARHPAATFKVQARDAHSGPRWRG
jgi:hypothetical protein